MAKRRRSTEEDLIFEKEFSQEQTDMQNLLKEALEQAKARAKAVQERIKAERERTKTKPRWKRTKEENKHADRIANAQEQLNQKEGE